MYGYVAREEEIMTDYQFKSILKMVREIAEGTNDVEKVKKFLDELISNETKMEENFKSKEKQ